MINRILKILLPLTVIAFIFIFYSSFYEKFTINLLRWGEIVVVISLLAGLYKFVSSKVVNLRDVSSTSFYSLVTIFAFLLTFTAGLVNFGSERFAFSNIIREQPGYLVETTKIVLNDDAYLRKFPAKNKLALLIASKISRHFIPTDEMLKSSGMNFEDYQNLVKPDGSQKGDINILDDDREYAEKIREKVTRISKDAVKLMIPVTEVVREWAYGEISSGRGNDLTLDGRKIKNSGAILKEEMEKVYSFHGKEKSSGLDVYGVLSKNKKFVDVLSEAYASMVSGDISKEAKKQAIASFIRTGVSASPRMKGTLRWIYRYVYGPLFSTFMAILVFFMVISAYRHFDLRKYSTAVITTSAVFVMLGFIPQTGLALQGIFPVSWQGPMSSGWIMNTFATPVFKAFAIGTGTGVIFMYISRYRRFFSGEDKK